MLDEFDAHKILIDTMLKNSPNDDIADEINKKCYQTAPYVDLATANSEKNRLKIIGLIRSRTNFFAIYNLFEWKDKIDKDVSNLISGLQKQNSNLQTENHTVKSELESMKTMFAAQKREMNQMHDSILKL